jgi:hypothetical protein
MSDRTMEKLENVGLYYLMFGMPAIALICIASPVVGLSILGVGLVLATLYVLADN